MGKLRSLTSDEILAQVYFANKVCRVENIHSIDNIVFMGMGEPADNAAAVVQAAKILVDRNMFGLASRRVTISTVGPSPDSFATLAEAPVVLAWSVHATRQDVREALVPTTKYSMKELRDGLLKALDGRSRALKSTMLEVTLLNGINDRPEDALDMVDFCQPISDRTSKVVVNLIPWNDIGASSGAAAFFEKPLSDRVLAFQKTLTEHGIRCYIRTTRGDEDSSACGQLATKRKTTGRSAP
jgi:23S rRNA (adenine2503-C2)-methyltransferase